MTITVRDLIKDRERKYARSKSILHKVYNNLKLMIKGIFYEVDAYGYAYGHKRSRLRNFIENRVKFEHGGLIHSDEKYNNLLYIAPHMLSQDEIRDMASKIKYRNRMHKFWHYIYIKLYV